MIATDNLVLWLGEAFDGKNWLDISKHVNNGLLKGAVFKERGFYFDGAVAYANCSNDSSLDITDVITIAAWVKLDSFRDGDNIISKGDMTDFPEIGYHLSLNNADPYNKFMILLAGTTEVILKGTTLLNADEWYFTAATYDGSQLILYLNGISDNNVACSGNITSSTQPLYIGVGYSEMIEWYGYIDGIVDEVMVYNTALTAAQIKLLYEISYRK